MVKSFVIFYVIHNKYLTTEIWSNNMAVHGVNTSGSNRACDIQETILCLTIIKHN